ncbi:hypothetical protein DERF_011301 [Dermatophagoides farinae]|uniref:Uncharacterized protein n=1 Tax=Dermatophagoides farinae TaxID=6954 RepID=A0A922KZA1_DERFA|nr:hypothetical protein DERF_011301 [Dermatophagoides farinae]
MNKNKNKISKTKTNSTTSGFSSISQSPSSSTSNSPGSSPTSTTERLLANEKKIKPSVANIGQHLSNRISAGYNISYFFQYISHVSLKE